MRQHVVTRPAPPLSACGGRLQVHQVPLGHDNLGWVAVCVETGACAAVDGPEAGPVLDLIEARGWRWQTILNTHAHGDHIGINRDLEYRGRLKGMNVIGCALQVGDIPGLTQPVSDGEPVRIGAVEGTAWLTEGHVDGHLSFVFDGVLFCGDTLFTGGCGRLFHGPPAKMHASLQRIGALPGDTAVCCAHEYTVDNLRFAWSVEPHNDALSERIKRVWALRREGGSAVPSTIAVERATNPFMRTDSPALRQHLATATGLSLQASDVDVFATTRSLKDRGAYREHGDVGLPI